MSSEVSTDLKYRIGMGAETDLDVASLVTCCGALASECDAIDVSADTVDDLHDMATSLWMS